MNSSQGDEFRSVGPWAWMNFSSTNLRSIVSRNLVCVSLQLSAIFGWMATFPFTGTDCEAFYRRDLQKDV